MLNSLNIHTFMYFENLPVRSNMQAKMWHTFELSQKNANVVSWDHHGNIRLREHLIMNAEKRKNMGLRRFCLSRFYN